MALRGLCAASSPHVLRAYLIDLLYFVFMFDLIHCVSEVSDNICKHDKTYDTRNIFNVFDAAGANI